MDEVKDCRRHDFYIVDNEIMDDERINQTMLAAYNVLVRMSNSKGESFPSHSKIMAILKVSKPTVIKALYKLQEFGYIRISKRSDEQGQKSNLYILLPVAKGGKKESPPVNEIDSPQSNGFTPPVKNKHTNKIQLTRLNNNIYIPPVEIEIFNTWNSLPGLIKHAKMKDIHKRQIKTALKDNDIKEIQVAMQNYSAVLSNNEKYYFNHKYTLTDFLKRGLEKFLDEANPLENFISRRQSRSEAQTDDLSGFYKPEGKDVYAVEDEERQRAKELLKKKIYGGKR